MGILSENDQIPNRDAAAPASDASRIHYASGLKQEPSPPLLWMASQLTGWGTMTAIIVIVVPFMLVGDWINGWFGSRGLILYLGVLAVVGLAAGVRWLRAPIVRAYQDGMELTRLPLTASEEARVRCIGSDAKVRRLGPISEDPFEPLVVRVLLADRPSRAFIWAWVLGGLGSVGGLAGVLLYRGGSTPLGGFTSIFTAFGAFCGLAFAGFAFPTYIRIAPGRVDVMKFGFLGRGKPVLQRHDVRQDRVTVLLGNHSAVVRRQGPDGPVDSAVVYAGSIERTNVARAILAAAISEHPTPPLPDDALEG